jgi:hypothetical protein
LKRAIQFEGSQSYGSKAAFGVDLTPAPRRPNDRSLHIPAEDPPRFGSDSGHLVADSVRLNC